jgi:F0F1-type ATP synthase membrane subunit c/vacuolar-type H+-ATPase subunit K
MGVGKAVGVAVGGNHTIVGVMVAVGGSKVSVGKKTVVGAAVQALHRMISKQQYKGFFIHASKFNTMD